MLRQILDSPWFYFALAAVLAVVAFCSQVEIRNDEESEDAEAEAELGRLRERDGLGVVFVLVDTLRADRLGSYGAEPTRSPALDRLASRGMRFHRAAAQSSWTKTSMASLWTATHPARSGVLRFDHRLPEEALLAAEILQQHGFRTVGLHCNRWLGDDFGFAQGFDTYLDLCPAVEAAARAEDPAAGDARITRSAIELLAQLGDEPFLVYLHYMGVHNYAPPFEDFAPTLLGDYDASVQRVDGEIGELLDALDRFGLRSRTVVVVASDHGEELGERGHRGHAHTLHREVLEVPLLIGLPFVVEPGVVVPGRARNVDVWPTLLDLLGLPALPDADGRSLAPRLAAALRGEAPQPQADLSYAELDRSWNRPDAPPAQLVGVMRGGFHWIEQTRGEDPGALYDHRTDPLEQRNVAAANPAVTRELAARVRQYLAEPAAPWSGARVDSISRQTRLHLHALGYALE